MANLPAHGRVPCTRCLLDREVEFDVSKRTEGSWRITSNPLAWGNQKAEVVVLGFSKGPTQAGALTTIHHDLIAFKGSRHNVGKILIHVGLLKRNTTKTISEVIDDIVSDTTGRFHFGSLIRCTVERYDKVANGWKGSGGGMLDKFIATPFGTEVASNCCGQFLGELPKETKLIIMFGLGSKLNYVVSAKRLFEKARGTRFAQINSVAYTDGKITVVHVEHFASQGALIPNWLGENKHERALLGIMARDAVQLAIKK